MIEGEREEEEERWDCRDSLFDGRNAREEREKERAMGTKALYCCIMIRLGGGAVAANDESAMKKLERSTCEWPGAVRAGGCGGGGDGAARA